MKKNILLFSFYFILSGASSQVKNQHRIDSLLLNLKGAKTDITKVNTLNAIVYELRNNNPDTALYYAQESKKLALELNYSLGLADSYLWKSWAQMSLGNLDSAITTANTALNLYNNLLAALNGGDSSLLLKQKAKVYNNIGLICSNQSNAGEALKNFDASIKIKRKLRDLKGIAQTYNNIGSIYETQGNYSQALKNYILSLKIGEGISAIHDVSYYYNNIGIIYFNLGNYPEALKNHFAALKIRIAFNDKKGIADSYNNIAANYSRQRNFKKALDYNKASLKIYTEIGNKHGIAQSYTNLAELYLMQNNSQAALTNYLVAEEIYLQLGDLEGLALTYNNIGTINLLLQNKNNPYFEKALAIALKIGNLDEIKESYLGLSELDSLNGNYKQAWSHLKLYLIYRDSLFNEASTKKLIQTQMQYDFDKKESLIKAEQEKKEIRSKNELDKQKLVRNSFVGGFILVVLIAAGIFRSLQQNRKAKAIITYQKAIVDEKNRDILDSIQYAKRLQKAILPANKLVKEYLKESFIFYKPKDIVAGDFYWVYPVPSSNSISSGQNSNEKIILFAAADCTGHGVPGAMVSVVCANALNKAVKELSLRDPGKILDAVNKYVEETFEKKEEDEIVQDGMDISLCALNLDTLQLLWSGANNALIIIRNEQTSSTHEKEFLRIKELLPNKQPIGLYSDRKPFTTHTTQLQKGDMLYLFSDGYADQFGGSEGKKLMKKNLKNLLLQISTKAVEKQQEELENYFTSWQGSNPQVDDVCVIGVRV
jgi:serine phosphatase RsbU (regulator of sigma subunit)